MARHSDRARKKRSPVEKARRVEAHYARQLRKIASEIGRIVNGFPVGDPMALPQMRRALGLYSEIVKPWAESTAARMVAEVANKERSGWAELSEEMSSRLKQEIRTAPTGEVFREMIAEQVKEITSLPLDAAERVYKLTMEGIANSTRASEIAAEIMRSGEVSASRANMIARTAVSTTASKLTQARAEHIGSVGYTWVTAGDTDVRESHRKMNGTFVRWDSPPTLDGYTAHAGGYANCRCVCLPHLPEL